MSHTGPRACLHMIKGSRGSEQIMKKSGLQVVVLGSMHDEDPVWRQLQEALVLAPGLAKVSKVCFWTCAHCTKTSRWL